MRCGPWLALLGIVLAACPGPSGSVDSGMEPVDSGSGADAGGPPANDTCATAEELTGAGSFVGSTRGASRDYATDCTGFANLGEDVVYRIPVPA
ncbi:MAG: hypothetical protein JNG84_09055, partial [Archangium sp.]|nr:hypothetical protein [Archangium sp.]